ncbi:MAG: glycosyltransferase [Chitinophagaceae bacterium]
MTKKIYSVIVHYNTPDDVVLLVNDLLAIPVIEHFVVVVDNCSENHNFLMLREKLKNLENVLLVQTEKNGGFAYGVNAGFEQALSMTREPFLLHVVNSDTRVIKGAYIETLARFIDATSNAGVVGPLVYSNEKLDVQNTILPITTLKSMLFFRKLYSDKNPSAEAKEPTKVDCVNGVCFMVRSEVFAQVGGISEKYFMYNEEQDLCFQVGKAGFQNYFLPTPSVRHEGAAPLERETPDWRFFLKRKNQVLFLALNISRAQALIAALVLAATSIPKYLKAKEKPYVSWVRFTWLVIKPVWNAKRS